MKNCFPIARNSCNVFKDSGFLQILSPRVEKDFALHSVNSSFAHNELVKRNYQRLLDSTSSLQNSLIKDAPSVIAKLVSYLINLITISKGETPSQRKKTRVTPIYETGKKDDENNHRPISVFSLVSKMMERAVQVQLWSFLYHGNKVFSVFQSGFPKKHSTETAVVYLVDQILEHMDSEQLTGAAFIDSKRPLILLITAAFFISYSTMVLEDAVLPGSEII